MNKLYNDTAVQAIANAIRAKNGSSDTYTIAEMSTALNDLSYYAKPTIENVPLATFEADGLPLNSLKVSVEAKQDLHGYDHPWVGGSGKNLCDSNNMGHGIRDNSTGELTTSSSTASSTTNPIKVKSNTHYVVTYDGTAQATRVFYYEANRSFISTELSNSFTTPNNAEYVAFQSGSMGGVLDKWQLEEGSTATSYEPYSNICPISGWSEVNVSDVDDVDNPTVTQTTTIALGQTVYGAEVDVVNGVLTITHEYIASYNGETLPSTWISSMDEYTEGTTPTTGAEVCYELASPIIINLTPTLIKSLEGTNNLSVDCGEVIELEYFKEV